MTINEFVAEVLGKMEKYHFCVAGGENDDQMAAQSFVLDLMLMFYGNNKINGGQLK